VGLSGYTLWDFGARLSGYTQWDLLCGSFRIYPMGLLSWTFQDMRDGTSFVDISGIRNDTYFLGPTIIKKKRKIHHFIKQKKKRERERETGKIRQKSGQQVKRKGK